MTRILALWLPNWPIQRLLSIRPELKQRPVVLYQPARRGQCVAACSCSAWQHGVREDMSLSEATALMRQESNGKRTRTPLHLEPHDPLEDRAALEKLAGWCHRFSPRVGLEESVTPSMLLLDVTGVASLFGGEEALLEQVAVAFQRLGLSIRIGLADTIGAAWGLARHEEEAPFSSLPCTALRLPEEMVATLARLGLYRVGDLLPLPRAELQARFGDLLLRRLDQALGHADEVLCPIHLPPELSVERAFEYPIAQRETIAATVRQLLEQLCFMLAERTAGALHLRCQFDCQMEDGERGQEPFAGNRLDQPAVDARCFAQMETFEVGLFLPTADVEHLLKLCEMQMERITLPGPVTDISLTVTKHACLKRHQQELFGEQQRRNDSWRIAALIDCFTGRLGRQAVLRIALRSDAQPEKAYRYLALIGEVRKRGRAGSRQMVPAPFPRSRSFATSATDRPLHLLSTPLPLPTRIRMLSRPPVCFNYLGQQHKVARFWGPERIETGWWRNRAVSRDYYRVETTSGSRFWLFRNLENGRWFLHGVF